MHHQDQTILRVEAAVLERLEEKPVITYHLFYYHIPHATLTPCNLQQLVKLAMVFLAVA